MTRRRVPRPPHRRPPGAGARPPSGARPGFTLVELVAAMLLLTVGLLAIAGLAATAA